MRSAVAGFVFAMLVVLAGCGHKAPSGFPKFAEDAVYQTLAFSPVNASAQGLHSYKGEDFDRELDRVSYFDIQKQRNYYVDLHKRMEEFDKNALSPEDRADYDMLDYQIGFALYQFDIERTWMRSPQSYVELLGSALFNPLVLEYAPKEKRFGDIVARLEKVPGFVDAVRRQLVNVPKIWSQVAKEENDGNIELIDKTLRAAAPASLRAAYDAAAGPALDSLRLFNRFLETELPMRRFGRGRDRGPMTDGNDDWRLGAESYATKFRLALATESTPDQVLADAEARLKAVRAQMLHISLPLHGQWFAGHGPHEDMTGDARENKIVREVLDRIAQDHSTPAGYFDDVRKDLDEARTFAQSKNLLTMPTRSNLQVIPTPEFERGIYGVGGFNSAPVLEPQLGAFFWITPIPADWPKARAESKLREYNAFNLRLLVLHEAMPGHYVQGEFANDIQPKSRRILRALLGNGPYIEGWAEYITQVMLDEGYLGNSPELRLTLLKQELRVDANAVMDIRMQTNRMTDAQAMEMMEGATFQEHEEAVAKLQRAKLSSTQLPMYFLGWRDWLRVRDAVKSAEGGKFNLHDFHDRALKEGAVPLPALARLLTGKGL
jgi:uncharacterized protein (DUF885 family)